MQNTTSSEAIVEDKKDGTYDISFTPTEPADYVVDIKMGPAKKPIKGSPFTIHLEVHPDPEQTKLSGPGLENPVVGLPIELSLATMHPEVHPHPKQSTISGPALQKPTVGLPTLFF
eukprot:TRINITY_DN94_c1_g1_i16.p1 TRINITY_DN94_c1_g1~~TRINITY_DN94_c1_g1_i16.p1  ORF type:complete len:116 (+),score=40.23 TRINITY_DN94_c1_g1_i16:342-689(+)